MGQEFRSCLAGGPGSGSLMRVKMLAGQQSSEGLPEAGGSFHSHTWQISASRF